MKKQTVKKHSQISLLLLVAFFLPTTLAAVPRKLPQFPEGERLVYTKIIESFRKGKLADVIHQRKILEKNYPASVHLDNANYLTGMLELKNQRFGEAIQSFQKVRNDLGSNKRAAALFGQAVAYQQLNLETQAQNIWLKIRSEYPGSPEAQKAWMQLRIAAEAKKAKGIKR